MSQARLQEDAAVSVQAMGLQAMKQTGADLARIMDSANIGAANTGSAAPRPANTISDPTKGNYLNMFM